MYSYNCRYNHSGDKLLIEFVKGVEKDTFLFDLMDALGRINPKIEDYEELWMNEEALFCINSTAGEFTLSKDVWGFAFIIADENQDCISQINEMLSINDLFVLIHP